MSDGKIARYYDESKNKEGAFFPGVPLRDLLESEYETLPEWLKDSVDSAPFYRKTAPPKPPTPPKE